VQGRVGLQSRDRDPHEEQQTGQRQETNAPDRYVIPSHR
jgi:hypothetical protein